MSLQSEAEKLGGMLSRDDVLATLLKIVASLELQQAVVNQTLALFQSQLKQLEQQMGTVSTELATITTQLDAVVAELPNIATAIASLQAQLAALKTGGSTLTAADQAALDKAEADAASIQTSVGNINTSLTPKPPAP